MEKEYFIYKMVINISVIVNRLKAADDIPADLEGMAVTRTQLDVCPAETMPLAALLFQGGYLTIKKVIDDVTFRLGIPNREIGNSLAEGYVSSFLGDSMSDWTEMLVQARSKDYAGPWLDGAPPVFLVGVNYDPAKRGIDDPLVERA